MKKQIVFWLVLIWIVFVLWFTGCDNDNENVNWNFEYPLTVGNSWEYDKIYTLDFDAEANSYGYNEKMSTI